MAWSPSFFCGVRHFSRSLLNILLYGCQVLFLLLVFSPDHSFLEVNFLLHRFLAFIHFFFFSQGSNSLPHPFVSQRKSVMVPRIPYFNIVVDASRFRLPPWPDDVIKLCCWSFFPFFPKLSVRAGHFFLTAAIGPRGCDLAIELLHNSIPHQLLETAMIVFHALAITRDHTSH